MLPSASLCMPFIIVWVSVWVTDAGESFPDVLGHADTCCITTISPYEPPTSISKVTKNVSNLNIQSRIFSVFLAFEAAFVGAGVGEEASVGAGIGAGVGKEAGVSAGIGADTDCEDVLGAGAGVAGTDVVAGSGNADTAGVCAGCKDSFGASAGADCEGTSGASAGVTCAGADCEGISGADAGVAGSEDCETDVLQVLLKRSLYAGSSMLLYLSMRFAAVSA